MSQSVKELTSGDAQGARALTLLSIRSMVMQSHSQLSVNYIYHPCNRKLIIFPLKQHILTKHFFDFTVFDLSGRRKMRNHIFHLTIHVLSKKKGNGYDIESLGFHDKLYQNRLPRYFREFVANMYKGC